MQGTIFHRVRGRTTYPTCPIVLGYLTGKGDWKRLRDYFHAWEGPPKLYVTSLKGDWGASSNSRCNSRLETFQINEADIGRVRIDAAIFILRRGAIHDVSPSTAAYCV